LRTEHDELGVRVDPDVVPGRPVEQVVRLDRLLHAVRVGRGDPAAQHEAPVRALAAIALESHEKRRRVDAGREREVLAADLAEPGGVAEIRSLADDHRARTLRLHVDLLFRYPHDRVSSSRVFVRWTALSVSSSVTSLLGLVL